MPLRPLLGILERLGTGRAVEAARPLFDLTQRNINQLGVGIILKDRDWVVMSDERTIAKAVGVSLTVVFVAILILSAISY
jgi:hypothetical protein